MSVLSFDVVYHLAGEQVLPNFIGIAQCHAPHHVIVASTRTKFVYDRLAHFPRLASTEISLCEVDAFNLDAIRVALNNDLSPHHGKNIGFNLTGGTKPMFAAAFSLCVSHHFSAFYVETTGRTIDLLLPAFQRHPLAPPFASVDDFVLLAGFNIKDTGRREHDLRHPQRTKLVDACWRHRHVLMDAQLQKQLQPLISDNPFKPFTLSKGSFRASLDRYADAIVSFNDEAFSLSQFGDLAAFLAGKWLEEFSYAQLAPRFASGAIKDLRIGLKPDWQHVPARDGAQEFDLALTDGFLLYLIECKAGFIKQTDFQKLENLAEQFGGTFGRGLFVNPFPPTQNIINRIKASRNVAGIFGERVLQIADWVFSTRPGTFVYQKKSS